MKSLPLTSKQYYARETYEACPNAHDAMAYVDVAQGVPLNAALVVVDDESDDLLAVEVDDLLAAEVVEDDEAVVEEFHVFLLFDAMVVFVMPMAVCVQVQQMEESHFGRQPDQEEYLAVLEESLAPLVHCLVAVYLVLLAHLTEASVYLPVRVKADPVV